MNVLCTKEQLESLPSLEVDNRKVHMFPWELKISNGDTRVWYQKMSGLVNIERWIDGEYRNKETYSVG